MMMINYYIHCKLLDPLFAKSTHYLRIPSCTSHQVIVFKSLPTKTKPFKPPAKFTLKALGNAPSLTWSTPRTPVTHPPPLRRGGAHATDCTDGLSPSVAFPQVGVGINIFKTTQLFTSSLGTDGTSRTLFATNGSFFTDPSCFQQYASGESENDLKLLEGSESIARQVRVKGRSNDFVDSPNAS